MKQLFLCAIILISFSLCDFSQIAVEQSAHHRPCNHFFLHRNCNEKDRVSWHNFVTVKSSLQRPCSAFAMSPNVAGLSGPMMTPVRFKYLLRQQNTQSLHFRVDLPWLHQYSPFFATHSQTPMSCPCSHTMPASVHVDQHRSFARRVHHP